MKERARSRVIFTIGHSNRPLEEFLGLLQENGVKRLVDVRTIPRSRHNPQYDMDALKGSLSEASIEYLGMKGLGGLRRPLSNSINDGWRNSAFRGFADYMQTEDFSKSLNALEKVATKKPTAVMCAEAVPWMCHRSLIADALSIRHFDVLHIIGKGPPRAHTLTKFAKVDGTSLTYPAGA